MSWVEQYRPRILDDVVGNPESLLRLKHLVTTGALPHLILTGPPGTGKTTSMMCLARQMGYEYLELNASDDRGIDVVRTKIQSFVQGNTKKLIILDEADSMQETAQHALVRILQHATFALACNHSQKLIEPLMSRCAILRFRELSETDIQNRLEKIIQEEKCEVTTDGLQALLDTSQGDLRRAINHLQSVHSAYRHVDESNVYKIVDQPHHKLLENVLMSCATRDMVGALKIMMPICRKGYAAVDIVSSLFHVCKRLTINDKKKLSFVEEIGVTHIRINEGVDTPLQLMGLIGRLCIVE